MKFLSGLWLGMRGGRYESRPILFSGPMVRALMENRKTQTQRSPAFQPDDMDMGAVQVVDAKGYHPPGSGKLGFHLTGDDKGGPRKIAYCPYGQIGDLLWVRETWAQVHPASVPDGRFSNEGRAGIPGPPGVNYRTIYRADGDVHRVWHCQGYPYRTIAGPADDLAAKHPDVCSEYPGWTPSSTCPVGPAA